MVYESNHRKSSNGLILVLLLFFALMLGGCATTEVADQTVEAEQVILDSENDFAEEVNEADPYENFNRKMFVFNEKLDTYVAKPVSDAYLWVTPQLVQTGIANFFSNLKDINVVLNDALQGKFKQSAEDAGRFVVNSTAGLLGIFDVATEIGLKKNDEDFAQTLAVWGVPDGPYLVLPVLGPSTSRGVPGSIFDTAANPTTYVGLPVQLVSMLNSRANAEGSLNFIDEAALDPYVFTRESFLQYRKHLISDGETEITEDILDLEDAFYDEEDLQEERDESIDSDQAAVTSGSIDQTKKNMEVNVNETDDLDQAFDPVDEADKAYQESGRAYQEAAEKLQQLEYQE